MPCRNWACCWQREKLSHQFDLTLTEKPVWLTDTLVTLGEIERIMDFEPPAPLV
ncbi:hypothetical protein [uncultured Pseudodesulfovibrio sp.]|uniref:hypothetical protein n=1 Tax=uncultured Pseudodesulfovibrio sp. TaxID=2035858 RepID=UPI0029C9A3DA|nr:hypothetical protein [uncultured Pseudodesulfovibrio sp.]